MLTALNTLPLQKETTEKRGKRMPLARYFKGHGQEAMDSMMKENHGDKDAAKREFYATANKTGMKPGNPNNKPKRKTIGQRVAEGA